MKKIILSAFLLCFTPILAQNTNTFPLSGNAAVGTLSPNFNFQLHGTTDYSITYPGLNGAPGITLNQGKTARLGLTNTTTGTTKDDGFLIRMSGLNGVIENLEKQNLTISSSGANLIFSGSSNRVWFSQVSSSPTSAANGYANIISYDNGLFIKNNTSNKYGLSVQTFAVADNAIQVMATNGTSKNFVVQGNGNVSIGGVPTTWGRLLITNPTMGASVHVEHTETGTDFQKLIYFTYKNPKTEILKAYNIETGIVTHQFYASGKTTINNGTKAIFQLESDGLLRLRRVKIDEAIWPDYVFEKDYKLPSLMEVAKFIEQNGHLQNVPTREEVLENGVEVGEMLRILLEKVEELTLYSIEQQKLIDELIMTKIKK